MIAGELSKVQQNLDAVKTLFEFCERLSARYGRTVQVVDSWTTPMGRLHAHVTNGTQTWNVCLSSQGYWKKSQK